MYDSHLSPMWYLIPAIVLAVFAIPALLIVLGVVQMIQRWRMRRGDGLGRDSCQRRTVSTAAKHRKVRIAVSISFGLLTLVLCALWVRSYWTGDTIPIFVQYETKLLILSKPGSIPVVSYWEDFPFGGFVINWQAWGGHDAASSSYGFDPIPITNGNTFIKLWFPIWLPTIMAATAAIAFWSPFSIRFSIRTMLIATTLVAIVLGLGVWAAR